MQMYYFINKIKMNIFYFSIFYNVNDILHTYKKKLKYFFKE